MNPVRTLLFSLCGLVLLTLIFPAVLSGQESSSIEAMEVEPGFDGKPFEETWEKLSVRSLVMLNPVSGVQPSQKTDFRIGFTDKYLYIAAYMYDTEPDRILATSKIRDDLNMTNDWFGINLDTYNDNENALLFATNPAGLRLDGQIIRDGKVWIGYPIQFEWNTVWEVKTSANDQGWFAEIRIPLSSIRYSIADGKVSMGLASFRYIARLGEWDIYPAISNEWGIYSWTKPSQYKDVTISGIKSVNPLYFSPYILTGIEQKSSLSSDNNRYISNADWQNHAGLDVKIGLMKNLTADLTINTDFAQVEADDQIVNLTRFEKFYPEKRQFFLERSGIFDLEYGAETQLFYSRKIGLYQGMLVPIAGGGRLTGRIGSWDVGLLSLQTRAIKDPSSESEIPGANNSVLRLRRKIPLNRNSCLGTLITSKTDLKGKYNLGYDFDGILNIFGDDYINFAMTGTSNSEAGPDRNLFNSSKLFAQWEKKTYRGLTYLVNYSTAGSEYDPALGFEYRKDYKRYQGRIAYGWIPGERLKRFKRHEISLLAYGYIWNSTGESQSGYLAPAYTFTSKKDHEFIFNIPVQYENCKANFFLDSTAFIPPGEYIFPDFILTYNTPQSNRYSFSSIVSWGKYYDGVKKSLSVTPFIRPNGSWNINLSYNLNSIFFPARNQKFMSQIVTAKILYMYSTSVSVSSYLQYSSIIEGYIWNVRLRYNPKEGNDMYLVYNDYINTERHRKIPPLPFSNQRNIMIKYTHTFRMR
jgi:hypothetical protein